jgi:hypothetical protein
MTYASKLSRIGQGRGPGTMESADVQDAEKKSYTSRKLNALKAPELTDALPH